MAFTQLCSLLVVASELGGFLLLHVLSIRRWFVFVKVSFVGNSISWPPPCTLFVIEAILFPIRPSPLLYIDVVGEINFVQGSDLRNDAATTRFVARLLIKPEPF
ncbi:Uncharacterized protein Rs2_03543 [Raphanus sativus]|nr:Uncharacterized protein Rs2_03543 [Raphanus sativus]